MISAVVVTTADSNGGPWPAGEWGSPTPAAAAAGWHRRCTAVAVARVTHLVKSGPGVFLIHVAPSPTLSQGRVCQPKKKAFC